MVPRDAHNVITELGGIGLGHDASLLGRPPGQANSDATHPCSSPLRDSVDLKLLGYLVDSHPL